MNVCRLLDEVGGSIDHLSDLQKQHEFVSTKTNTLHQSCEHLLEEQTGLMNVAEAIQSKLSYFNELDRINTVSGLRSAGLYVMLSPLASVQI